MRVLLQILPLIIIIATLLDGKGRGTVAALTQVRLALAGRRGRVRLAGFAWRPSCGGAIAPIIARQGASLLVCQHVSVSSTALITKAMVVAVGPTVWQMRLWRRLLAAVCAAATSDICRGYGVVAGLALRAVVTLVRLLLEIGNLLLQQVVIVNGHDYAEVFCIAIFCCGDALTCIS